MTCARCETLPERSGADRRLYVWPPEGPTTGKVAKLLAELGAVPAAEGMDWPRVVSVSGDDFEQGTGALWEGLTSRESEDVRVLMLDGARLPTLQDIPAVCSLAALRRRLRSAWVRDLLAEDRLITHFQPIFPLGALGRPMPAEPFAYEALSRGLRADGSLIGGGTLVSAASEADLLFQFDRAARLTAVDSFAAVRTDAHLFVNFSPTAIYDPNFCLRTTIARTRALSLDPGRIVFEVIESEQHKDLDHLERILTVYRDQGFRVALDDFGTGYSNYEVLERLRPDFVKIDMALVRAVNETPFKAAILDGLVALCRRFGITTLAEGIETEAELAWLSGHGIDLVQGFLLARPGPLEPNSGAPDSAKDAN